MKKHILLIWVLAMLGLGANAQTDNTVSIGIKGGINMPKMMYRGNKYLSSLPQSQSVAPVGGVFVDIPLGDIFALAPEFDYVQRGTDITYKHLSGAMVHYALSVSYADFRLPVEFRIPIRPYLQPYLTIGGEGGMRLGGKIHIDRTAPIALDSTVYVGDANMTKFHVGAFAGLGIRSLVSIGAQDILLKLSVTYHQGFLDTYAKSEIQESVPAVNVNAYVITGSRLPRGLEVALGVSIPLKPRVDDACSTFSHDRYRRRGNGKLFGF